MRKLVFGVSDQVRHKPDCTTTEDSWTLEISELGSRGISYPCSENKDGYQLRSYREADLRLCFRICKKPVFSQRSTYELRHEKPFFAYAKKRGAYQIHANGIADQCLCFHYIVQSLYLLYPNFQASSHLLLLYSPVCVKHQRQVFSRHGSYLKHQNRI